MNNGKYVNKDTIIKRVNQYYGLDASGADIDDFIYDCLRGVGGYHMWDLIATNGLDDNPNPIKVTQYRGILPNNIEYPVHVIDYDTSEPLMPKDITYREDFLYTPYNANKIYNLKRNHIHTSEETQNLILIYLGFPLDDAGDPLVPDDENYLKVVTAYVAKSIAMALVARRQLDKGLFDRIEQDYFAYSYGITSAEYPNEDEMEQLKNQMMQMLPDYTQWNDNFRTLGMQHKIKYI